jgi:hypothetical protein
MVLAVLAAMNVALIALVGFRSYRLTASIIRPRTIQRRHVLTLDK